MTIATSIACPFWSPRGPYHRSLVVPLVRGKAVPFPRAILVDTGAGSKPQPRHHPQGKPIILGEFAPNFFESTRRRWRWCINESLLLLLAAAGTLSLRHGNSSNSSTQLYGQTRSIDSPTSLYSRSKSIPGAHQCCPTMAPCTAL